MEAGTLEGRVEVCINNAWGTVCDNFFGQEDAETVCASIGGFNRTGENMLYIILLWSGA